MWCMYIIVIKLSSKAYLHTYMYNMHMHVCMYMVQEFNMHINCQFPKGKTLGTLPPPQATATASTAQQ